MIYEDKFYKQFPSFKNTIFIQTGEYKDWCDVLQEKCLDKQKVKELLNYIKGHVPTKFDNRIKEHTFCEIHTAFESVLKELGLE